MEDSHLFVGLDFILQMVSSKEDGLREALLKLVFTGGAWDILADDSDGGGGVVDVGVFVKVGSID